MNNAESNKNPHNSGADIYLQNGATWNNEWIGMERPTPKKNVHQGIMQRTYTRAVRFAIL